MIPYNPSRSKISIGKSSPVNVSLVFVLSMVPGCYWHRHASTFSPDVVLNLTSWHLDTQHNYCNNCNINILLFTWMPRRGWAPPTSPTAGPTCRRPGPPSPRPWTGAWGWSWASGKRSLRPGETTRRTWCPWCWRTAASSPPARGWTATSGRRTRASPPRRMRSRGWRSVFWAARGLVRCSPCLLSAHTQLSLDTLAFYYENSIRRSLGHNFDFNCFQFQQKISLQHR